jgi:hypothetical protein
MPFSKVQISVYHVVRFFVLAFCSLETIARGTLIGYPWVAIFFERVGSLIIES